MSNERERARNRGIAIGAGGLIFIEACAIAGAYNLKRLGLWDFGSNNDCPSCGTGPRYGEVTPTPASVCILPTVGAESCSTILEPTLTPTPTSTPGEIPTSIYCGTPVATATPTEYKTPRPSVTPTPGWPTPVPTNPDRDNPHPQDSDSPDRNPPTQIP